MTAWLRLYRLIVRAARGETVDLRTAEAEETFTSICQAAARRGRLALTLTALRELSVIAGLIALGYLGALPGLRLRRLPDPADSLRGLRIAVRTLFRSHRGYVAMATFVLAVAVGVNLLVFTIVNALWIRPLPFPEADRVVTILDRSLGWLTIERPAFTVFEGGVAGQLITAEPFEHLRPGIELAAVGGPTETLAVTAGYFRVLGLSVRGRDFSLDDERGGPEPVAIISDRLWARAFGRRADIIGAVVPATPVAIRIIGVAPPDFHGARRGEQTDIWVPLGSGPLMILARLGPGQTIPMAEQRYWELEDEQVMYFHARDGERLPVVVPMAHVFGTPDTRTFVIRERDGALVVAGLALLVLLGGCATIAALVLVHYERRRAELAVRMSLGAGRGRLTRELLRDLSLVALAGSAGGLLVAALGVRIVPALSLPGGVDVGRLDLSIDWRVAAVGFAATAATLLVAAALPIARATHARLAGELVTASASTSRASQRIRQTLLALQVCATIVVLVAAGLFVRVVIHGFGNAPGFDVNRTVFVSVREPLSDSQRADWRRAAAERTERLRRSLRAVPGVREVAEGLLPIGIRDRIVIRRLKAQDREHELSVGLLRGSPEQLSALGVPMLAGRRLTEADSAERPAPAAISMSLAQRLWPDGDALAQMLTAPQSRVGPFLVVGIIPDLPFGSLAQPGHGVVVTAEPNTSGMVSSFVIRADNPPAAVGSIRRAIQGQFVTVVTGREIVARDLGRQRLGAWFFSGFGLAALLLGIGGAFGLVAYLAESRRREFGVRLALGATMGHLMRQGLVAALLPVSAGVAAGLFLAAVVARVFESVLTGISALDGITYVAVAVTTLGCATVAAVAAAWRLRSTSPADALRTT